MYYDRWPVYVPVAKRRAKAAKEMAKLRKKGLNIQPIKIEGRKITQQSWGIAWCEHIEQFGDFENRLPRGKSYVRNGSVCHLTIEKGMVNAIVSGSKLYKVKIRIKTFAKKHWTKLITQCSGKLHSILELLQGILSDEVMAIVTNKENGLFPKRNELTFDCNCPDYASMCKHIAAVFYGIGSRLDSEPELLFGLRGVDYRELIKEEALSNVVTIRKGKSRKRLDSEQLSNVFGIEIQTTSALKKPTRSARLQTKKPVKKKPAKTKEKKSHDKELQYFSVAKLLDQTTPVKRAIYTLSDGHWRKVEDLTASLSRRVKVKTINRRHRVWYYQLDSHDEATYWLEYARRKHNNE